MYCLAADISSGAVLSELPLTVSGGLQRALMTVSEASFNLPIHDPRCPTQWETATAPWRVMLAVVDEASVIVWAGIPTSRTWVADKGVLQIKAVSVEGYLDRRYVQPATFKQADQCSVIARALVESTLDAGLSMDLDTPASGVLRDRTYTWDESGSVLKRLQDLAGVINGPEWWIETTWADAGNSKLKRIFHTGYPRIGVSSSNPPAVFEIPGGLSSLTLEERWDSAESATHVIVTGEGEGEDKPRSDEHVDTRQEWAGYPRLEMRINANNVADKKTLDAKAARALERFSHGVRVFSIKQKSLAPPRLGRDWGMGDDVRLVCNTDLLTIDETCRLVGWEVDLNGEAITPIIAKLRDNTDAASV